MRVRIENIECRTALNDEESLEFEFVHWVGESEHAQYPRIFGWLSIDMERTSSTFVSAEQRFLKLEEKEQLLFFRVYKLAEDLIWEKLLGNAG
jgi:hypothetical protein